MSTSLDTFSVEPSGSNTPTVLAKATAVPMRTQVSNVGPVVLFVSDDVTDLVPGPGTGTYRIIPGEQHVLVLGVKQSLYAIGAGTGGLASVASSPALLDAHSPG